MGLNHAVIGLAGVITSLQQKGKPLHQSLGYLAYRFLPGECEWTIVQAVADVDQSLARRILAVFLFNHQQGDPFSCISWPIIEAAMRTKAAKTLLSEATDLVQDDVDFDGLNPAVVTEIGSLGRKLARGDFNFLGYQWSMSAEPTLADALAAVLLACAHTLAAPERDLRATLCRE